MQSNTPELSAEQRKVLTDIAEYGCHVVSVPEDGETPDYSFTVGLWHTWQHPEVAVVGLDEEVAQDLLNAVADLIDEGATFTAGQVAQGLIDTYPVTFKAIPEGHVAGYLGTAAWANEGAFPVLQLVYPDKLGRYPWHEGCAQGFRELQPLIADLPAQPAAEGDDVATDDAP
jgi:hypothetical protein